MAGEDKFQITRFDGLDFSWWRKQMTALLVARDLADSLVEDPPIVPTIEELVEAGKNAKEAEVDHTAAVKVLKAWTRMDQKALAFISLGLTKRTSSHIDEANTAKEAMEKLANVYEKPSAGNQMFLLKKLMAMKLDDGVSVADHVSYFAQVTGLLLSSGIKLDERVQVLIFLNSLPESYSSVVQGISATIKDDFTLRDAQSVIMDEEMRRKASGRSVSESDRLKAALAVANAKVAHMRGKASGGGGDGGSGSGKKGEFVCWKCGEAGHTKRKCPQLERRGGSGVGSVDLIEDVPLEMMCLSLHQAGSSDSGSSDHGGARRVGKQKAHAPRQPRRRAGKVVGSSISQGAKTQGKGRQELSLERGDSQVTDREGDAQTSAGVGAAMSDVLVPGKLASKGARLVRFGTASWAALSEDSDDSIDHRFGHGDHDCLGDLRGHRRIRCGDTDDQESGSSPTDSCL